MGCRCVGLDKGKRPLEPLFLLTKNDWEVDIVKDLFSRLQGEVVDSERGRRGGVDDLEKQLLY